MHNVDNGWKLVTRAKSVFLLLTALVGQRRPENTKNCNLDPQMQLSFTNLVYLCKLSRELLSICLNKDRLSKASRVPRILDLPASTLHSQGQIEGCKEKENKITCVSNYFPWIWHPSINWYYTQPYHFKMPKRISPHIKLIKLLQKETLELKNKLNLSRPRPLGNLILPGWAKIQENI